MVNRFQFLSANISGRIVRDSIVYLEIAVNVPNVKQPVSQ